MSLRPFLLASTVALLLSAQTEAAILQDLTISHSFNGKLESNIGSAVGTNLADTPDFEYGEVGFSIPGSDGMRLDVSGVYYKNFTSDEAGYFAFTYGAATYLAAGAPVEFSLTTTIEFTLDYGGSVFAWPDYRRYDGAESGGTYALFINGTAIEETGTYVLQQGLNTIILTGDFSTASLNGFVSENFVNEFWITPDQVPEPGSWVLLVCGGGATLLAARRRISRAQG